MNNNPIQYTFTYIYFKNGRKYEYQKPMILEELYFDLFWNIGNYRLIGYGLFKKRRKIKKIKKQFNRFLARKYAIQVSKKLLLEKTDNSRSIEDNLFNSIHIEKELIKEFILNYKNKQHENI